MKTCLLIPIYDHGETIRGVVESLAPHGLPCLIVDDGSGPATREVLERIAGEHSWVSVHHRPSNAGKGVALKDGYRLCAERGFTHAIQLDADGQHDAADVPRFEEASREQPDAHVLGEPIFDASVPRRRLYARQLSRVLVWMSTLSFAVRDPLCGFRCVPLAPALKIIDSMPTGDRMDLEPELAVRLFWEGLPVVNVPTRVVYHPGGLSHFHLRVDYPRLVRLYARLLGGMLRRVPTLVVHRRIAARSSHGS